MHTHRAVKSPFDTYCCYSVCAADARSFLQ